MSFEEIIEKYPNWAKYIKLDYSGNLCFKKYEHTFVISKFHDYSNIYKTYDYIREFLLANDFFESSTHFINNMGESIIAITCNSGSYFYIGQPSCSGFYNSNELIVLLKKKLNINDSINKLVNS